MATDRFSPPLRRSTGEGPAQSPPQGANAGLRFEVADDGRGFDPATARQGTGLQGITDRIDALGGHVHVDSGPGQGTRISGQVPASATT